MKRSATAVTDRAASLPTAATEAPLWHVVSAQRTGDECVQPVSLRRTVLQVSVAAALVLLSVAVLGAVASRRAAEREAVQVALKSTDLLAESVVQPALTDALLTGSPKELAAFDKLVKERVRRDPIVRIKLWTPDGRIVYSDEPRLIGTSYPLDGEETSVLRDPAARAEVSDLHRPENRFETSQDRMLECYRPIWTPSGQALLFETYSSYRSVQSRSAQLWRGFTGITVSSLLLLLVLLLPLGWTLMDRVRRAREQREGLLRRAVNASEDERARIAATLHDGVVQDLVAASYVVAACAERASSAAEPHLAAPLEGAAASVRSCIGGLRSLLVDIYPPTLRSAGLAAALSDLAGTLRSRGVIVRLDIEEDEAGLPAEAEAAVFAVAQECIRNAGRHADATCVDLTVRRSSAAVLLDIRDDGRGFDVAEALRAPAGGHFGLSLMEDVARRVDGRLAVSTRPGGGTWWRLEVPVRDEAASAGRGLPRW